MTADIPPEDRPTVLKEYREQYKRATATAQALALTLSHEFDGCVHLVHYDGSVFYWVSASVREIDERFFAVYTEHHGHFVYDRDDVVSVGMLPAKFFPRRDLRDVNGKTQD